MEVSYASWLQTLCNHIKSGDVQAVTLLLNDHCLPCHHGDGSSLLLRENPLHLAVQQNKLEIVELLLQKGAHVDSTNLYGETPLHVACRYGNTDMICKLLSVRSALNSMDCGESTPMFHAVYYKQAAAVDLLIRAGANLDTLNEELMTPLDHAVLYNQQEIISLLLKGGCTLEKSTGTVWESGHYSNSILFSLWTNKDLANISVLLKAGYKLTSSHLNKLFLVGRQLQWDTSFLQNVEQLMCEPLSLKDCCRVTVRRHLMNLKTMRQKPLQSMVLSLPLPSLLRDFVSMFDSSTVLVTLDDAEKKASDSVSPCEQYPSQIRTLQHL
ncbi:ankyrin repeat and SOCS box protein 8-like [Dreissena polymorpha]|uniref:SOCS box domain-containing protein n=1 Tax=Dreissena polymorpha TaxID=45954 RepID=A0A9D4GLL1_DREPO|nr:ankyrin repeat and SOCS box protein 8-like [Dreissena polymorpha]KAH3819414.1 hypothetical protein DPMN_121148 [Dreissena polymorpha]